MRSSIRVAAGVSLGLVVAAVAWAASASDVRSSGARYCQDFRAAFDAHQRYVACDLARRSMGNWTDCGGLAEEVASAASDAASSRATLSKMFDTYVREAPAPEEVTRRRSEFSSRISALPDPGSFRNGGSCSF